MPKCSCWTHDPTRLCPLHSKKKNPVVTSQGPATKRIIDIWDKQKPRLCPWGELSVSEQLSFTINTLAASMARVEDLEEEIEAMHFGDDL